MNLQVLYLLRYVLLGLLLSVAAYFLLVNVFGKNRKP